ncbi:MAG: alpha/beta hydrolase [Paracoccaceae bacterium]
MSLQLRLLNFAARTFMQPKVVRAAPLTLRADLDRMGPKVFFLPPYTLYSEFDLAPGLRAAAIARRPGSRPPQPDRRLLWFHGGAFMGGSPRTHARLIARVAGLTRLEAIAPDYRRAPEDPFPAAVEDARTAFDTLVARGFRPDNIVIGGDSAGGNLALGLLAGLLAEGTRPAGVVALSPVTDLTFSGASVAENLGLDPMVPGDRTEEARRYYLVGAEATDPRASPLFADFPNPPPVFLQYGGLEILRDDSRRMAEKLRAAGGEVVTDEWPDAPHVFTMFDAYVPEAREGLARVARFIDGLWAGRD